MRSLKLLAFVLLLAPAPAFAQPGFLVRTDLDAKVEIDGQPVSAEPLRAFTTYVITTTPGDHLLSAIAGVDRFEQVVTASDQRRVVLVNLAEIRNAREGRQQADQTETTLRSRVQQLQHQLSGLRAARDEEQNKAAQAKRQAEDARAMYAPNPLVRNINETIARMAEMAFRKHSANAETLDRRIGALEDELNRLRYDR